MANGTVETDILRFGYVDTAIHCAEEKVGAIAEADFWHLYSEMKFPQYRSAFGTITVRVTRGKIY